MSQFSAFGAKLNSKNIQSKALRRHCVPDIQKTLITVDYYYANFEILKGVVFKTKENFPIFVNSPIQYFITNGQSLLPTNSILRSKLKSIYRILCQVFFIHNDDASKTVWNNNSDFISLDLKNAMKSEHNLYVNIKQFNLVFVKFSCIDNEFHWNLYEQYFLIVILPSNNRYDFSCSKTSFSLISYFKTTLSCSSLFRYWTNQSPVSLLSNQSNSNSSVVNFACIVNTSTNTNNNLNNSQFSHNSFTLDAFLHLEFITIAVIIQNCKAQLQALLQCTFIIQSVLKTALVNIRELSSQIKTTRVHTHVTSMTSSVSENLVDSKHQKRCKISHMGIGNTPKGSRKSLMPLCIQSQFNSGIQIDIIALMLNKVTALIPSKDVALSFNRLHCLIIVDPIIHTPATIVTLKDDVKIIQHIICRLCYFDSNLIITSNVINCEFVGLLQSHSLVPQSCQPISTTLNEFQLNFWKFKILVYSISLSFGYEVCNSKNIFVQGKIRFIKLPLSITFIVTDGLQKPAYYTDDHWLLEFTMSNSLQSYSKSNILYRIKSIVKLYYYSTLNSHLVNQM